MVCADIYKSEFIAGLYNMRDGFTPFVYMLRYRFIVKSIAVVFLCEDVGRQPFQFAIVFSMTLYTMI